MAIKPIQTVLICLLFCDGCAQTASNSPVESQVTPSAPTEAQPSSAYEQRQADIAQKEAEVEVLNKQVDEFLSNVTPKQRAHLKDWKSTEKFYEGQGYLPDEAKIKADEINGPEWPEPLSSNFVDPTWGRNKSTQPTTAP